MQMSHKLLTTDTYNPLELEEDFYSRGSKQKCTSLF